jgi:hypothetical protein
VGQQLCCHGPGELQAWLEQGLQVAGDACRHAERRGCWCCCSTSVHEGKAAVCEQATAIQEVLLCRSIAWYVCGILS